MRRAGWTQIHASTRARPRTQARTRTLTRAHTRARNRVGQSHPTGRPLARAPIAVAAACLAARAAPAVLRAKAAEQEYCSAPPPAQLLLMIMRFVSGEELSSLNKEYAQCSLHARRREKQKVILIDPVPSRVSHRMRRAIGISSRSRRGAPARRVRPDPRAESLKLVCRRREPSTRLSPKPDRAARRTPLETR